MAPHSRCYGTHVEISGQLAGVSSLLRNRTQIIGLGSRCLHLLNHLESSTAFFSHMTIDTLRKQRNMININACMFLGRVWSTSLLKFVLILKEVRWGGAVIFLSGVAPIPVNKPHSCSCRQPGLNLVGPKQLNASREEGLIGKRKGSNGEG